MIPIYLKKDLFDKVNIIDDDWLRKYISFKEINKSDPSIFSSIENMGILTVFGLICDDDELQNGIMRKEIYNWCIENHFRYKKVRYVTTTESSAIFGHMTTTGVLFNTEEDALAFKMRWL